MHLTRKSVKIGERCNASVTFPKQGHGRCQPIAHKPVRYKKNIVEIQAIKFSFKAQLVLKRQIPNAKSSTRPTINIKCLNDTSVIGSVWSKICALPNALIILTDPMIKKITPDESVNRFNHFPDLSRIRSDPFERFNVVEFIYPPRSTLLICNPLFPLEF